MLGFFTKNLELTNRDLLKSLYHFPKWSYGLFNFGKLKKKLVLEKSD